MLQRIAAARSGGSPYTLAHLSGALPVSDHDAADHAHDAPSEFPAALRDDSLPVWTLDPYVALVQAAVDRAAAPLGMVFVRELNDEDGSAVLAWRPPATSRHGEVRISPSGEISLAHFSADSFTHGFGCCSYPDLPDAEHLTERMTRIRAYVTKVFDACPSWPGPLDVSPFSSSMDPALNVFALTTLKLSNDAGRSFARSRTVGVFDEVSDVHALLQDNVCDLEEAGYYPMALVERVQRNSLYAVARERLWYQYDQDFGGYRPCSEPAGLERVVALGGIG
jgi:hypothetical protein